MDLRFDSAMLAVATFGKSLADLFFVLTGTLLYATDQFIFLALDELQIIVRKLREFLLQLALGNVPVSFEDKCAHNATLIYVCYLTYRHSRLQELCRYFSP